MTLDECQKSALEAYRANRHPLDAFRKGVVAQFEGNPQLGGHPLPVLHSMKSRMKSETSLMDKVARKFDDGVLVTAENLFKEITDLAGVRLLHLHQDQFAPIHLQIQQRVDAGDWHFGEPPVAYSWDPELNDSYGQLGIRVEVKASHYTSVHYLIKPRADSPLCCELQVRTLFEEAWGEIDHAINYPHKTTIAACQEQIRVLSKLVATGTRLADAIFRTHAEGSHAGK